MSPAAATQVLLPWVLIDQLRTMVWEREASVRELHQELVQDGYQLGLRTLHAYVYELQAEELEVPPPPTNVAWWSQGERSPNTELTREQAAWALGQKGRLSSREVSERLGSIVVPSTVRMIWAGLRWRCLHQEGVHHG